MVVRGIDLVFLERRFTSSATTGSLTAKRAEDGAGKDRWRLTTNKMCQRKADRSCGSAGKWRGRASC
jgi:hypothetical protein